MALMPRDVPITREQVYGWLQEYVDMDPNSAPTVKDFIAGKINDLNLSDHMVNTADHSDLDDTTPLLDMIVDDLPSYGYSVK